MFASKAKRRLRKVKKIAGYTSTAATVGILITTLIQKLRKKKNLEFSVISENKK